MTCKYFPHWWPVERSPAYSLLVVMQCFDVFLRVGLNKLLVRLLSCRWTDIPRGELLVNIPRGELLVNWYTKRRAVDILIYREASCWWTDIPRGELLVNWYTMRLLWRHRNVMIVSLWIHTTRGLEIRVCVCVCSGGLTIKMPSYQHKDKTVWGPIHRYNWNPYYQEKAVFILRRGSGVKASIVQ